MLNNRVSQKHNVYWVSLYNFIVILILAGAPHLYAAPPSRQIAKLVGKTLEAQYEGQSYTLRRHPNHSGNLHIPVGTNNYVCEIKSGPLFPLPDSLPDVMISKVNQDMDSEIISRRRSSERKAGGISYDTVSFDSYCWKFSLKHPHLGRGEITITTETGDLPDNLDELKTVLGYFLKGGDLPEPKPYVGNAAAKTLHYLPSGHIFGKDSGPTFSDSETALAQGYKECPLCFNHLVYLSHLHTEMAMGKESEASVRHYYQIHPSAALQQRVTEAGKRVLANWPMRLKGYTYRFRVVDDDEFNASGCPGGYIFINSGLLEALESEDELEAVLAHEIAHVELRHGLMEYLKAQRDTQSAAIFATIVTMGAAAGAAANNADVVTITSAAGTVSALLASVAAQVSLMGYSKEHEIHADVFALMYLQNRGISRDVLNKVLRKIRTSQEIEESIAGSKLTSTTHPVIRERLFISESLVVHPVASSEIYDAYDKNGELLYSFTLEAQAIYQKRDGKKVHILLGELHAAPAIGEVKTFESIRFSVAGKPSLYKTDGKTILAPLDTLAIAALRTGFDIDFLPDEFTLSIDGISEGRVERRTAKTNAVK